MSVLTPRETLTFQAWSAPINSYKNPLETIAFISKVKFYIKISFTNASNIKDNS